MADTTKLGNAGEHLVMAELLYRGFHAFRADRSNPAFDISVHHAGQSSLIRVKTTSSGSCQWTTKANGTIFLELQPERDFVALVNLASGSLRSAEIYVIPTSRVDWELRACHSFFLSHPRRDG